MPKRLRQMDKNLIDELLSVSQGYILAARRIASGDEKHLENLHHWLQNDTLSLLSSINEHKRKHENPIATKGQRA